MSKMPSPIGQTLLGVAHHPGVASWFGIGKSFGGILFQVVNRTQLRPSRPQASLLTIPVAAYAQA